MRRMIALLALLLCFGAAAQVPPQLPIFLGGRGGPSSITPILYVGNGAIQPPGGNFPSPLVVPLPSGVISGDYMFAFIWTDQPGALTPPAGWTLVKSTTIALGSEADLYSRVAGGSEPANYTWTNGGNPAGGIRAYRNVSVATPVDASAGASDTTGTNVSIPSMTATALANELYVGFWENESQQFTMTIPPGFGNVANTNNNINIYIADKAFPIKGSAVPVQTATLSGTSYWNAIGVTLRPLP